METDGPGGALLGSRARPGAGAHWGLAAYSDAGNSFVS
jgi:hypothetical protein